MVEDGYSNASLRFLLTGCATGPLLLTSIYAAIGSFLTKNHIARQSALALGGRREKEKESVYDDASSQIGHARASL